MIGELVSLLLILCARPARLLARNYRQAEVIARGGITLTAPLALGAVVASYLDNARTDRYGLLITVGAVASFGLLGWLDDVYGTPDIKGLRGHLSWFLRRREITTGLLKAVGGAAIGVLAAYALHARGWSIIAGGAVIALSANVANSIDTRPGRAAALFLVASAALLASWWREPIPEALKLVAILFGAILVFAPADFCERIMLGDTGANPLGAALGIAVIAVTRWPTWAGLAIALLLLSLAADRWSLAALLEARSKPEA